MIWRIVRKDEGRTAEAEVPKLDFQAVILAGGLGTRMRPLTEKIPKPMIAIGDEPFLQRQFELLASFGLRRVLLLVAYLGEQIERHFGDGAKLGLRLAYSHEPAPLGTGGALKNAETQLDEEFVVLNGDTYLAIDYAALIHAFRESRTAARTDARATARTDAMIVAYDNSVGALPAPVPSNLVVASDGRVTAYRKRDSHGLTHVDAGVVVLRREVLADIPSGKSCSLEEEIYPRLIAEGRMRAWVTREPFYDIGSPQGLAALTEKLA